MIVRSRSRTQGVHWLQPIGALSAVSASGYLTWVFSRAFFTEVGVAPLVADFLTPFFTVPIIFMSVLLLSNIRRKTYMPEKIRFGVFLFLTVPFYLLLVLFIGVFALLLGKNLANTPAASLRVTLSLLAEIIAIAVAVGTQKTARLAKVFGLLVGWSFSFIGAFLVLGLFLKQHPVAISKELRLVFAGIFFHAANLVYLGYAGIRGWRSIRRPG